MNLGAFSTTLSARQKRRDEIVEISARKDMARQSGSACRFHVGRLVTNHEAPARVDGKSFQKIDDHAGFRLPPLAGAPVTFDPSVRMKRAILESIDACTTGRQLARHPIVQNMYVCLLIESPGHARLVGYYEGEIAGIVDRLHGLDRAVDPDEL